MRTETPYTPEDFQFVRENQAPDDRSYARSPLQNLKQSFRANPMAKAALFLLLLLLLSALLAPLSPYDPYELDPQNKLALPSAQHPFGTDDMGRDYLTRALYGGRVSLVVGLFSVCISTTVGTLYGTVSGYIGGRVDIYMMRLIDIVVSVPGFLLIVVINTFFTPSILTLVLVIGMFTWQGVARITRAETLSLKKRDFVLAARALGVGHLRIIVRHSVPNLVNQILVAASVSVANAIMLESSLSFLGYGISVPMASWGGMLQNAQTYILDRPLMAVFPGIFILLTILSLNILSDMLRDALNPKLNQ